MTTYSQENDKQTNVEDAKDFIPPRHLYGHKLAIYHANRAASLLQLGRIDETIDDCTIAILYNPLYVKAYTRRSTCLKTE